MRERFGIPFFFTAHSLGAVKAQWLESQPGGRDVTQTLARRIAAEQCVIEQADLIVAISEDEASHQYGLYQQANAMAPISINPPGCDLARFSEAACSQRIKASLGRFLADADKPMLLCLARPVRRKNLLGIMDAYAQDPALRQRANLVILAGTRSAMADQEPECREVLQAMIDRTEYHDLYGRVALPKHHHAEDVPAIYQWAARSGGLFINVAFHEPFGLTFVEAAAAGLPVVATRNGGAQNIVTQCGHGLLVDPQDSRDIAATVHQLLDNMDQWHHHAISGPSQARHYSWPRHAKQYLTDYRRIKSLTQAQTSPIAQSALSLQPRTGACTYLLVTDMDDTLLGDTAALAAFSRWVAAHPHVCYTIATGRTAADAWAELLRWNAPLPDVLISSVGAEIHWLTCTKRSHRKDIQISTVPVDSCWAGQLSARWQPQACADVLSCCDYLTQQAADKQRPNKLAYTTNAGADVVPRVQQVLANAGLSAQILYSHGQFVDVLAPGGAKDAAAVCVAQRLGIARAHIIGAGNSGNDIDLLQRAGRGIAVGNCDADLLTLASSETVYFARAAHAAGLLEGLHYWLRPADITAKAG